MKNINEIEIIKEINQILENNINISKTNLLKKSI
jgi:hypothetical protein